MSIISSAITGKYKLIGDLAKADCLIGLDFGASNKGAGYVNEQLAKKIDAIAADYPQLKLLVQQDSASAMTAKPTFVIKGKPSTAMGGELGTWEVLAQAKTYMDANDLRHPALVAQAYHMGRATKQVTRLGMDPIVTEGMPRDFDPHSTQSWTRNLALWIPRELLGMVYLKTRGKL